MRQTTSKPQVVLSVIADGASLFELATPAGVWSGPRTEEAGLDIEFVPCAVAGRSARIEGGMTMDGLESLADHIDRADMVIVPTWPVGTTPVDSALAELLARAHGRGARIVGLCLGAFAVAAAGLLDDRTGVTHWRYREQFECSFPSVTFVQDTLYVDHDTVVTSAGSAAAVDCCLHLVRRDHGAEAAAALARTLVTAPHRAGTQSQFAAAPPIAAGDDPLSRALAEAAADIAAIASVADLAALAGTGRRSIERHLQARLGISPKEWIDNQRVITACRLLERTDDSIDEIARRAGYGSTPTFRRAMERARATTPTAYRAMFRG